MTIFQKTTQNGRMDNANCLEPKYAIRGMGKLINYSRITPSTWHYKIQRSCYVIVI